MYLLYFESGIVDPHFMSFYWLLLSDGLVGDE